MPAEDVRTFIPTAPATVPGGVGIDIAIECRVGDSQPPPDIVWFQDDTPLVENTVTKFLEGGRWAYIRDIEDFPREYHCEVSNVLLHNTTKSPQTYFVNGTGLVDGMNFVYKEIGDLTAFSEEGVDEDFEFSFVASQGTLSRLCFFFFDGSAAFSSLAFGTIPNLPTPPPAVVTLQCRSDASTVVSGGTVTVQRELYEGRTHTHTLHTHTHTPTQTPHTLPHTHAHTDTTHTHTHTPPPHTHTPTHTLPHIHRESCDNGGSLERPWSDCRSTKPCCYLFLCQHWLPCNLNSVVLQWR